MTFLINEQNVSFMYIDINAISRCLINLNIFQQDECFCSKPGMEVQYVEYAKSNLKTFSQLCVICQLLPFVRVGQYSTTHFGKHRGGGGLKSNEVIVT